MKGFRVSNRKDNPLAAVPFPSLDDGVALITLGEEAVLYRERTGTLHRLNHTGSQICKHLDGSTDIEEIAARVSSTFDVSPERIVDQVRTFTADLESRGLVALNGNGS